jgi:hypothetical protein
MNKNGQRILNQNGMGMTEILVALFLIALAAIFGADVSILSSRSSQYSDSKNEEAALSEAIYNRFKYTNTCDQSFGASSGMNMLVSPANQALMFTNSTTGWPIKMVMPNLQAGVGMNLNVLDETLPVASRSIFPKKLVLEKLRLANGALLTTTATQNTYAADIYVQFSQLNGIQLKERNIGTVIITSDIATGAVVTCNSISDVTIQSTCAQMGCTYIPANPEPCQCFRSQVVCAAPGYFPVAFSAEGVPDCRQVGGDVCPAGEFLTEFGIDFISCAPSPVCPPGTANNGLGMQASPALCKCLGATETWNGTNCVAGGGPPPGPNCPAQSLSWTLAGVTCSAPFPSTADTAVAGPIANTASGNTGSASFRCVSGVWNALPEPGASCALTAAPLCTGGATTTVSAVPASPAGCFCAANELWSPGGPGVPGSCITIFCYEQLVALPGTPLGSETSYYFATRADVTTYCGLGRPMGCRGIVRPETFAPNCTPIRSAPLW